jgi:hypothetical protein
MLYYPIPTKAGEEEEDADTSEEQDNGQSRNETTLTGR